MSQTPEQRAAEVIERTRRSMTEPGVCHCTGACRPNPDACPAVIDSRMTLDERLEDAAKTKEIFGQPEVAALIRAAKGSSAP